MTSFVCAATIWINANPLTVGDIKNSPHLLYGRPGELEPGRTLIARRGYAALHDDTTKTPLWVSYRLVGSELHEPGPRPSWKADPNLLTGYRAEDRDYRNSGFERGHMAANADITKDRDSQIETFYLSNVVPQDGDNNAGIWARLEERGREYAERYGQIYVITGPIFDRPLEDGTIQLPLVIGESFVRVPTHLFRIYIRKNARGSYFTLALVIPNLPISPIGFAKSPGQILAERPPRSLRTGISATKEELYAAQKQFLTTIDRIEEETGLNLLNALPVHRQKAIEAKKASKMW